VPFVGVKTWALFFNGSVCDVGCGISLLITSPRGGARYQFAIQIKDRLTNNQAEYEALCRGRELLLEARAEVVEAFGDSKLAIN